MVQRGINWLLRARTDAHMKLNVIAYQYRFFDGYGRYVTYLIKALLRAGVEVHPLLYQHTEMSDWLQNHLGISWEPLTISCLPAYYLCPVPGRHWLYTMTEGSEAPDGWVDIINKSGVERVIVPCEYNAEAFRRGGVTMPVYVVPGGTDPDEFPVITERTERPYTFLALGDRGSRKGWCEVWAAFYKAFGSPTDTPDVRLIIKARPEGNDLIDRIAEAENPDPRVTIWREDVANMAEVYACADSFVIPSRSEGWGMPHREAAMMGLPVITQAHSGMDDGHTKEWALVIPNGKLEPIPSMFEQIKGEWMRADVDALSGAMRWCYDNPDAARRWHGEKGATWLREHQTWSHTAGRLLNMIREAS